MGEEVDRFRERAAKCRGLAKIARDEESRRTLTDMADDLDLEADKIDAEEKSKDIG